VNGASWEEQILKAKRNDSSFGIVSAIKLCSSITGWTLKEAKDEVFAFIQREGFDPHKW
jgi:ribosomal protein L7/L12